MSHRFWLDTCQPAFNALKTVFTEAPVLHHWVLEWQITIKTDASNYAITLILSILGDSGEIHPVVFQSQTLSPSELSYDMHDKELLAIFDAFTVWQHYLEGAMLPVDLSWTPRISSTSQQQKS